MSVGGFIRAHWKIVVAACVVVGAPALALAWQLGSPLFLNTTVEEEFPFSAGGVVPAGMTREQVEGAMAALAMIDDEMTEPMTPPAGGGDAVVVKAGMFRDADSFHKGSGRAAVYRLADGSHVLRLEDFRVTNGPDLRVLLSAHPDPQGRSDVHSGGYLELGKLKGNIGSQNYPLPAEASPDDYGSVTIYCKPFRVVFSVAPLSEG